MKTSSVKRSVSTTVERPLLGSKAKSSSRTERKAKSATSASNEVQSITKKRSRAYVIFKLLAPILILLFAYYYKQCFLFTKLLIKPSEKPDSLMNYGQFQARYPRNFNPNIRLTEKSLRSLLFDFDITLIGRNNLYYLTGEQSFFMRQSPFKADRTKFEQLDILSQLDDFNMTQFMIMAQSKGDEDADDLVSYSGSSSGTDSIDGTSKDKGVLLVGGDEGGEKQGAKQESSHKWLKNVVKAYRSKRSHPNKSGDQIPSYPLNAQPDPNKITHLDADLRGCIGPQMHNQLKCGACYAFSWNSYAEWHYCKQSGGKFVDFSEQHIVDCGHKVLLNGCVEGKLSLVRKFSHTFGFNLESDYPYKGKVDACQRQMGSVKVSIKDFKRIKVDREQWEEVLKEQPILVKVHLPERLKSNERRKEIHSGRDCTKSKPHGMVLVGYGREANEPYWLLRNSMGANWGEGGYLRLSREAPMDQCFGVAYLARFKFEELDDDRYHEFYGSFSFEPTIELAGMKPSTSNGNLLSWLEKSEQ